jgi:hypothetical protein
MAPARLARIALIALVVIGGFVTAYVLTSGALAPVIWASAAAHVVLLVPYRAGGGRANVVSIISGQPFAMTEGGRATIDLEHVTSEDRRDAFIVFGMLFTLPVAALLLEVFG